MTFTFNIERKSPIELLIEDKMNQKKNGFIHVKRGGQQLFPSNAERNYGDELNRLVSWLISVTINNIYPELPKILSEAELARPTSDRMDDFGDDIDDLIQNTSKEFENLYPEERYRRMAESAATEIAVFNRKEVLKVFKRMIGVDIFFDEPWLSQEMNAFVKENVSLIKTISDRYFSDIEKLVYRGASQGIRHEEIRKQIIEQYGKTRNIAKRIARDQVNKFNGQLTQLRQTQLGVRRYVWQTMEDRRVRGNPTGLYPSARPSHWARDGKIFYWNNPPAGGHPGQAILCRCFAEPVIQDVIDRINAKKENA